MALTNKDENFCFATGLAGILGTIICVIAYMIALPFYWTTFIMMSPYLFAIIGFLALMLKKQYAPVYITISAFLLLCYLSFTAFIFFRYMVIIFSWGNIIYFFFLLIIIVAIYGTDLSDRLRVNAFKLKKEKNYWDTRI